ncbi:MAG TPA: DEDD exonuclease domain-containing protein [Acidimicrobiia bacterium]|nr:DEDD exonuclease domain-containing protein [Acidimicrobiia bacterium]
MAPTSPLTAVLPGFEATAPTLGAPRQQSLADLGAPLSQTTFVVLDLETTGGSANTDAITEIGALRLQGGELLGRFETLVNPGVPIPPMITVLTGITESMVFPAPRVEEILPPLLEFIGDAVIVGHNIRFDCAFLDAALVARGYARLQNRRVDTLALARRLVRDEIPNLRLSTLARHFRTSVEPTHRAYADAAATAEVLHALLERAASYGVLGLDDLIALPKMRAHPSAAKLSLTARLPRKPGVYIFRDRDGRVLYVGKATNLRARVRSYFASDDRRKVPQLLRELTAIDHRVCGSAFEAEVRELRLIRRLQPRFNRRGKSKGAGAYLKLTNERFPRLTVTRTPAPDDSGLGPFSSTNTAHLVREAIESAVPLRRCTTRVGRRAGIESGPPCTPAQLGVAACPCHGHVDEDTYSEFVATVKRALTTEPEVALTPLAVRMHRLADDERFEEAAATRDRLGALAQALERRRTVAMWRGIERLVVECDGQRIEIVRGLVRWPDDHPEILRHEDSSEDSSQRVGRGGDIDEILTVDRWINRNAGRVRVSIVDGELASALPRIAGRYAPG